MANGLHELERMELTKYRFKKDLEQYFHVADLLNDQFLRQFMKNFANTIGAESERVAASIFIKRYAFIAVNALYSMTVWNKKMNVSFENIKMETPQTGKDWLPSFTLDDQTLKEWREGDRTEWRKDVVKDLFSNNLFPIIEKLEKAFNISKLVLWENIAVYLFWLYESELRDNRDTEQVNSDFRYLIFEAEGSVFGRYQENPLQNYYSEKTYMAEWDEEVRVRKTCCFTYQLASSTKRCKTCPCTHSSKDGRCYDGETICGSVRSLA